MATTPPPGGGGGGTPSGMSTPPGGTSTPPADGTASQSTGTGRRNRRRNRGKGAARVPPKLEGKTEELSTHVYSIGAVRTGQSLFAVTTREIGEYIARNYKGGGEFMTALDPDNLGFDPLPQPADPADADNMVEVELWKLKLKTWMEKKTKRDELRVTAYAIVLGQCTETLIDRIRGHPDWATISEESDVIGLLRIIRQSMHSGGASMQPTHSLQEAEDDFMSFRQEAKMSVSSYFDKFKELLDIYEDLGGRPGVDEERVNHFLVAEDPEDPTEEEWKTAKKAARDEYLAVRFLRRSHKETYHALMADLKNQHTRGTDQYPKNLYKAYEILDAYVNPDKSSGRYDPYEEGTTFAQTSHSGGGGRGGATRGRGGGRGSSGRGASGGRGPDTRGSDRPSDTSTGRDESQQAPDNSNSNGVDEYTHSIVDAANALLAQSPGHLPDRWLLLDSCSSVDLVSNASLLHNVYDVKRPLRLHCNAGTIMVHQKGYLGDYPYPVWYCAHGIANVLSLNNVAKKFRVTMDTSIDNRFSLHKNDGNIVPFRPSGKGLYHYHLPEGEAIDNVWSLLTTVANRADKYTKRAVGRAAAARRFQNIIMRPGVRKMTDVAISHLRSPFTRGDVQVAEDIYGPNLGSLKGKTPHRPSPHVQSGVDPVPAEILEAHRDVTLCVDIMFVSKVPFLVTISRNLKIGTVDVLRTKSPASLAPKLAAVIKAYEHRGFKVTSILGDQDFEPLRPVYPMLNCCAADEHVPDIERYIRTIKDRARSCHRTLPFKHLPRIVLIHLIRNSVFWLNALPADDGVSSQHSPRYLLTGRELSYDKHVKMEFGAYVQTHEEHTNDMRDRSMGAICLGPTGNNQGGHWFMSLTSGSRVVRHQWTELPMPSHVIARVSHIGREQGMPATVTYSFRQGEDVGDPVEHYFSDDDGDDDSYDPSEEAQGPGADADASDDDSSYDSDGDDSEGDDDEDEDGGDDGDVNNQPRPPSVPSLDSTDEEEPWDSWSEEDEETIEDATSIERQELEDLHGDAYEPSNDELMDEITLQPQDVAPTYAPPENPGVGALTENQGVGDGSVPRENLGVEDESGDLDATGQSVAEEELATPTLYEQFQDAVLQGEMMARDDAPPMGERPKRRERKPGEYIYLTALLETTDPDDELFMLLTAQMNAKKGLETFGERGEMALTKELEQVLMRRVFHPKDARKLTPQQKRAALRYLMFLKEKRSGDIKGRGCADGRKQRVYKTKEETSAPTVSIEALMLSCMIDAKEGRHSLVCDIPNAFMQAEIDEVILVKFEGALVDILVRIDNRYAEFVTRERGRKVVYVQLDKALYGTMQAALLFWEKLSGYLVNEMGFELNPYDRCVANKMINGKQCTVIWYVDDLKISHVENQVVEDVFDELSKEFGKEAPLSVSRGKVHKYLGMTIDYSKKGSVVFSMPDYIDEVIEECPIDLKMGPSATPAANHLFNVNERAEKLGEDDAEFFHHMTAKLLYLSKRVRPDLQTAVSFLTTRVSAPDVDDYKKLGRCLRYLRATRDLKLTLKADNLQEIRWWVDASFAVHPDMKSHTGAAISLGQGVAYAKSTKQKLNTRSSTEAELVGVNDAMTLVLWTRKFLEAQGYDVTDNVVFQDNQSTMLLANNGSRSSSKRTRHLDIRYYFITDNIARKQLRVAYCPTEDMVADFFTKPLQGSAFRKLRNLIMNIDDGSMLASQECVGAGGSGEVQMKSPDDATASTSSTTTDVDDDMRQFGTSPAVRTYADVVKGGRNSK